ncbi:hypothetical protein VTL71DRAFT_13668 [Oculimacula yallundae]|uniref:RING-type domain-containing protein n=1 Tax=Oculimacula yallundae TaxID=86028 RepID=A0ABR4CL19_9HELO
MSYSDAGNFLNDPFANLAERTKSLGENPKVINPDFQSGWEIREMALNARAEQTHYDLTTRTQKELQEVAESRQFYERRLGWFRARDNFYGPPHFRPNPHVIFALARTTTPDVFFVEAQRPFQYTTCTICQEVLTPEVEAGNFEVPVNMVRELDCGHLFHHVCLETWLVSDDNPRCPVCRSQYNVLCAYPHTKPVWRFYPNENMYHQISGHVPFPSTGRGGKGFNHLGDEPDPWGDLMEQ